MDLIIPLMSLIISTTALAVSLARRHPRPAPPPASGPKRTHLFVLEGDEGAVERFFFDQGRSRLEPSFSGARLSARLPHVLSIPTDMDADQVRQWVAMRAERSGLAACTYLGAVGDDMTIR